jgi:DNA-binding PadR family transcriptional regulator
MPGISAVDIPTPESAGAALTPAAFHILLVLASGPAHGYAMMSEVQAMTGGRTRLGPGTLYRSLFKLLGDGWIVELPGADGRPDADERRRVYRITAAGLAAARTEARRLEALVGAARHRGLLAGSPGRRAPGRRGARS